MTAKTAASTAPPSASPDTRPPPPDAAACPRAQVPRCSATAPPGSAISPMAFTLSSLHPHNPPPLQPLSTAIPYNHRQNKRGVKNYGCHGACRLDSRCKAGVGQVSGLGQHGYAYVRRALYAEGRSSSPRRSNCAKSNSLIGRQPAAAGRRAAYPTSSAGRSGCRPGYSCIDCSHT